MPLEDHNLMVEKHYKAEYLYNTSIGYADEGEQIWERWKTEHWEFLEQYVRMQYYILHTFKTKPDLYEGLSWFRRCNYYIRSIDVVRQNILDELQGLLNDDKDLAIVTITVNVIIMLFALTLLMPFVIYTAKKTTRTLVIYTFMMDRKSVEIRQEKRKTEHILNQMLPKSVAYK